MESKVFNEDCMVATQDKPAIQTPEERKRRKAIRAKNLYQKNIVVLREKQNARRLKNREEYNKYRNNYRTKNPSGIYDVLKQGASKRNIPVEMSRQEFIDWYNTQERICMYCLRHEDEIKKDVDIIQNKSKRLTIDRLINEVGYLLKNIGLACRRCNTIKGNFFSVEEMKQIGKIINNKHACK